MWGSEIESRTIFRVDSQASPGGRPTLPKIRVSLGSCAHLGCTVNRILLHILTKKYVRRCQDNAGFPHAGVSQAERYETAETKIRGLLPKTAGVVPLPENESRGAHTSDMSAFLMTALRSDIFDYLLNIYVLCSSVRKRELCLDASSSEFESVRQRCRGVFK